MSILSASIYCTTFWNSDYGTGSVFSVSTTGSNYSVLHSFNCRDGFRPWCDLALSGNTLYGTTYGASPYSSNCTQYGNVFKVNTDGNGFAVLKDFNGSDGGYPRAGLVLSADTL